MKYYIDFITLPLAVLTFAWLDREHWTVSWVIFAVLGVFLFTLLEYWIHRMVLHRLMWHSTHQRHHTHPEEYVVFPMWYTPVIFAVAWLILPAPLFVGFLIGAIWFFGWHHAIHHWTVKPAWIKTYERWHDLHHADLPVNYGITHPLWDMVFGTYMSYERGRQVIRERRRANQDQALTQGSPA